jgi:hypothetical protein
MQSAPISQAELPIVEIATATVTVKPSSGGGRSLPAKDISDALFDQT